jgi:hypothetical protein
MRKEAVAAELLKIAKSLMASSLIDGILRPGKLGQLSGFLDEETYDLMIEVYAKLKDDLRISSAQSEAINRLNVCSDRGKSMRPEEHRNNIFKAAHALGIRLPSMSF